jgi:hypothetical protein
MHEQEQAAARQTAILEATSRGDAQRREQTVKALGNDVATTLQRLEKVADDTAKEAQKADEKIRAMLAERPAAVGAGSGADALTIRAEPNLTAWLQPNFVIVYALGGHEFESHRAPPPVPSVGVVTELEGLGTGVFDTVIPTERFVDWWFDFTVDTRRSYDFWITAELDGYWYVYADDGAWDSKNAHVRIDATAKAFPKPYFPSVSRNLLNNGGDNINQGDRGDMQIQMEYASVNLGPGESISIMFSEHFYAYARGGNSKAWLDYGPMSPANHLAPPLVHIF